MIDLKTGYSLLRYTKFNILEPKTYLAPAIRFFDNLRHKAKGIPYCKYSHSAMIVEDKGEFWIYEAIESGYEKTVTIEDYLSTYHIHNFLLLKPKFKYDETIVKQTAESLSGKKYDYIGLLDEAIYLTSNERVWLGKKVIENRVFCTDATAYIWYKASDDMVYSDYSRINPIDLFTSEILIKEQL